MRNFFFILKSLCGGKPANTPPSEFSYASHGVTLAFLKPLALVLMFMLGSVNIWGTTLGTKTVSTTAATTLEDGDIVIMSDGTNYFSGTMTTVSKSKNWVQTTTTKADAFLLKVVGEYNNTTQSYKLQDYDETNGYLKSTAAGQTVWDTQSSNATSFTSLVGVDDFIYRYNNSGYRRYDSNTGTAVSLYKVTIATNPTINTSVSSLSEVGYSMVDFSQQVKLFTVSGSNLTANVTVTAPTNYEVCKTSDGTYTSSVSFDKGSGTLSAQTVYVRLQSGKTAGNYSGNVACTSDGATTKNVAVSGSVPFTVTWKANGTTHATTYVAYATSPGTAIGSLPDAPDPSDYTCTPKAFYGWYDGDYSHASTAPTCVTTATKITADKTYNAVFATATPGDGSASVKSTGGFPVSFTTSNYSSGTSNGVGTATITANTGSATIALNTNATGIYFAQKASGAYWLFTIPVSSFSASDSITLALSGVKVSNTDYKFTYKFQYSTNGSSYTDFGSSYTETTTATTVTRGIKIGSSLLTGNIYIKILSTSGGGTKGGNHYINSASITCHTISETTYSNYATSCCTALGQINGSVLVSPLRNSATVSWSKVANASGYEYKLGNGAWTTATVSDMDNPSTTISGLEGATQYSINLRATGTGNYCSEGPALDNAVEFKTLSRVTAAVNYNERGAAKVSTDNENWYASVDAADGTIIYLQATPSSASWILGNWGASNGDIANSQLTNWTGDVTVTANFAAAELPTLATPTGMSSSALTATSATISWNAVEHADSYTVSCSGGTPGAVTESAGVCSCTITGLNAGTAYTWNVQAIGDNISYKSGAACADQNFTTVAKQPTSIVITSAPTKTVYLEGESFDATGLVVNVAYNTGESDGVYSTITPSGALSPSDNKVTISVTSGGATVSVNQAITVRKKYVLTFNNNGSEVSHKDLYEGAAYGELPVLTSSDACDDESNTFMGWSVSEITEKQADAPAAYATAESVMGASDVVLNAVWAKETIVPSNTYAAITSTSDLEDADYVIAYSYNNGEQIVLKNTEHASSADGKLAGYSLALSGNKYSNPSNAYVWTLQAQNDGSYYIYNAAIEKYVNATTTAATLSDTPTKFTLEYNSSESRWIIKLASNTAYAFHGYVTSKNNSVTDRDFRVSSDAISHNNASRYRIYLYKNEKETTYSEFRTNCCSLKPVTGLTVSDVTASSVTLNWTAPTSTEGITKLQVVNADNSNVLKDNIDKDATSAEVTGLETCTTYNLKVVSVGADCSSNSNIITATPQAEAKTVTFKYNDDVTADVVASTTCEADYVAVPANPTRSGYRFMGWKNGDVLVEGETFTPTAASTTIEARWAQLFTVHYDYDGASGAPEDAQYIAGEEVTLTDVEPSKGVLAPFKAWAFSTDVEVAAGKFNMPASDLTITATYNELVGQWMLVTDESSLNVGDYVIIAAKSYDKAMKTTQSGSKTYREITAITKSGSIIENPSNDVQIFVLEEGTVDNSWAFKCLNGDLANKYIYANSGSNNTINSQNSKDANASWKLNIANGTATAQGTNSHKVLQYNNSDARFSCYETASQFALAFYQFREGTFYEVSVPEEVTGGSVTANTSMAKAGETVTLTYAPSRGYTVETLTVTGATSGEITISPAIEAGVTEYTFTMPAEAVTVAASFEAIPPVVYNLVENADELAVGMQFLMVGAKSAGYEASGAWNSGGFLAAVNINAPSEKKISITTEEVEEIILEGESGAWLLVSDAGLLRESSKNLYTAGEPSKWTITITGGTATVHDGTYPLLYNASGSRFKTYDGTNDQIHAIALYALPYTTFNFTLSGCKTIKVADGYTYTYTIKNTDVPSETPDNCEFYAWTDGTNYYRVGDPITVNTEITLTAVWKEILRGELYEGKWGTICPDHRIIYPTGASFYTLTYLQMEAGMPYKLFFDEVETDYLEAGKPYLFIAEGAAIKGIKVGDKVTTAANYNGFYGNVSGSTNTISTIQTEYQASGDIVNYYGLKNNTFTLLGNGTTVANERAVVQIKNGQLDCPNPPLHLAPARPGVRRVIASNNAPQIATGVDELNASETPVKMVIDGQLFILRGEKMYDATGRLVK